MARLHGALGGVYMSTTTAGAATPVMAISQWSLSKSSQRDDATGFFDTNTVYAQGLQDVSGSLSAFIDDTEDKLFQAAASRAPVKLYLYRQLNPVKYEYGMAFLDMQISVSVGGAQSVTADFVAAGPWGSV